MNTLRHRNAALLAANQKLARVSQLRRDFLQIALHNLRSPVGAVSMHISNLAHGYGGPLSETQQAWVERAQCRLEELSRFLHDLEYMAALEAEELEHHTQEVDLAEVVDELLKDNRDLADKAGHRLSVTRPAGPANVPGIPRLIREALANYITNAIKYTPKGGQIHVRVIEESECVRVEVQDTGIGIAPKDQVRLFHELVRVHRSDSPVGEVAGSGLGLYIVQRIAEMHHARIDVKSEEGQGSTFSITFPKAGHLDAGALRNHDTMVRLAGGQADA
jgi:two-component system phosphate regulon sensor histidine kinase PhoR